MVNLPPLHPLIHHSGRISWGLVQLKEISDRLLIDFIKVPQLNHIDPPLSGLTLRDEGLRLAEQLGDLHLRKPRRDSSGA